DPHEAILVDARDVPGPEPTVGCEPIRQLRPVGVGRGHRRGAHLELSGDRIRAELDPTVRPARGAELGLAELARVGRAPADDLTTDLGLPVAVQERDAEPGAEPAGLQR